MQAVLTEYERFDQLLDRTLLDPSTWAGALIYALSFALAAFVFSRALGQGVRHVAARGVRVSAPRDGRVQNLRRAAGYNAVAASHLAE